VLFVDNLTAQQADQFKVAVASHGGVVWYGLKSATDLWQVVDAGIAQTLKVLGDPCINNLPQIRSTL